MVYKIEDMKEMSTTSGTPSQSTLTYKLHLTSPEQIISDRTRISETMQGTCSEMVEKVLTNHLKTKKDVWIDVPHFFTRKSFYDKSLDITNLTTKQRELVEEILGKTKNPVQTILAATGEISAITRRNLLMQGMLQNSANAL